MNNINIFASMLDKLTQSLRAFLAPGPAILMPVLVLIFVLIIRAYDKKSLSWFDGFRSAIMLGVAFMATGLVIGYMVSIFDGPFEHIKKVLSYNALDLGWAPMAAISWSWPFAILMFPLQIVTNVIMLKMRKTKTLTVDLWNVWGKVVLAVIISAVTTPIVGAILGVVMGLSAGVVVVIVELLNGDALYEETYKNTKIPNISCPHNMMLLGPLAWLVDKFLLKFKFFRTETKVQQGPKPTWLRMMGETVFAGFFVGIIVAAVGIYFEPSAKNTYMQLPFKIATALVLFPATARFFVESLTPIGTAVQKITQRKFQDREIYIGLDFPILAGNPKLWLVATLTIPFIMLWSIAFSFVPGMKAAFPLGGLINVAMAAPLLLICKGNVKRMLAASIILTPVFLAFGSFAAPIMTKLAVANQGVLSGIEPSVMAKLGKSLWITSNAFDKPDLNFLLAGTAMLFTGQFTLVSISAAVYAIFWIILFRAYYRAKVKENAEMKKIREKGQ